MYSKSDSIALGKQDSKDFNEDRNIPTLFLKRAIVYMNNVKTYMTIKTVLSESNQYESQQYESMEQTKMIDYKK